jgi:PAS domain S-box-containing protein
MRGCAAWGLRRSGRSQCRPALQSRAAGQSAPCNRTVIALPFLRSMEADPALEIITAPLLKQYRRVPAGVVSEDIDEIRDVLLLPVIEELFDPVSDIVFFVKDRRARYVAVNRTLVQRCSCISKSELLGKTTLEIFPAPMAEAYHKQDKHVLRNGTDILDLLELHLYSKGKPGWCITTKQPLRSSGGEIVGLVGISKDIHVQDVREQDFRELAKAVEYIQTHYDRHLNIQSLACMCGLSVYQLEQRMKRLFGLTAGQFIIKTRIQVACDLLRSTEASIVEVALDCGFSDQSAFTRQFKITTGMTPTQYREGQLREG